MSVPKQFQSTSIPALALLFAFVGVILGITVTYGLYTDTLARSSELSTLEQQLKESGEMLQKLDSLKTQATAPKSDVAKYVWEFREDTLLENVFALAGSGTQIEGISLDSGEKLASGMTLVWINLSLQTPSLQELLAFLDSATGTASPRRFVVRQVSFPYDSMNNLPIAATIQLGMYSIK